MEESTAQAAKGALAGAAGGAAAGVTGGLKKAAGAAGDVLTGIFGALPWEMSPGEIVNAVTGGAAGAPGLIDVLAGVPI